MVREFTNEMGEISGFGGTYEDGCRTMVLAGLEWFDNHKDADPKFSGFKHIYGIINEENQDAKDIIKYMDDAAENKFHLGGVTGAMVQATVSHVMWIKNHSWDEYVNEMTDRKNKPENDLNEGDY